MDDYSIGDGSVLRITIQSPGLDEFLLFAAKIMDALAYLAIIEFNLTIQLIDMLELIDGDAGILYFEIMDIRVEPWGKDDKKKC